MISTGLFLLVKDESFNGFHELGKVLVSTDFSESIFRSQDSGNAPAMPHVASSPAFDSSGDLTDSTEQRLDRIRAAEEASEVSGESQTNDGQCFLKALFETAGSITIDGSEPLDRFVDEASCIVVMRLSIRVVQTTTCFALKLLR